METINEPNIAVVQATLKAPGNADLAQGLPVPDAATTQAMIAVHHATRARLAERHPGVLSGWGVSVQDNQAEPGAEDAYARCVHPRDEVFLEAPRDDDWVGVQAYTGGRIAAVGGEPVRDPDVPLTQTGWEDYPAALGGMVRQAARVGGVPVIVTDNGIATADDARRIAFTAEALNSLRAAMDDGVDVRGCLHWSLLDKNKWGSYGPAFGLAAVNRVTFRRTPRPSLAWLGGQRP